MLKGWRITISKAFFIPQRWILAIMGFLGMVNAYTIRLVISIAITEMVLPSNQTDNHSASMNSDDLLTWTDTQQGIIQSSFYWGYVLCHIPTAYLVQKFGGKHCFGMGIFCGAVLTLGTPITALTQGWEGVTILRFLIGVTQGTSYPALSIMMAKWVPLSERGMIGSLVFAGGFLGTILTNSLSGLMIDYTKSWTSVFYFFGGLSLIWCIFWCLLCYSEPNSHPFISDKEKKFLSEHIHSNSKKNAQVPWKAILTSVPVWSLIIVQIGHDWGFFAMVTDLPKYMKEVMHFDVKSNGFLSSIPYAAMLVFALLSGGICDWLISKKYMNVTFARKFFTAIASFGPGIFIMLASYSGYDRTLTVVHFTIAMALMGTYVCGLKVNTLDLSPNYAGSIMSLVNGIGALSGVVVPILISELTKDHSLESWRFVFWITFIVLVGTCVLYMLCASGEIQWWNEPIITEEGEGKYTSKKEDTAV